MLSKDTILRYLSISHHTAPVARRERFHMGEAEKEELSKALRTAFPDLSSLLILVTCNRTELYFETEHTSASEVRDFLLKAMIGEVRDEDLEDFRSGDRTEDTVRHLLRVSAGLESAVLGDAEIICQIKKAYRGALGNKLQGSLLERCMQTLFRCHKRVSNETRFRDGTTSTAYKALRTLGETFGPEAGEKRILLVGAGDIVQQLFKYNSKFGYQNIHIANRTEAKAHKLARLHKAAVWPWSRLQQNDLEDFDVIISAASHAPSLIRGGIDPHRKVLLIDLAVPGNFAPGLRTRPNVVFEDLDSISAQLQHNREMRNAAAENVRGIVDEEWHAYLEWYRLQPFRELMAARKQEVLELLDSMGMSREQGWSEDQLARYTNQIMRKVLKSPEALHNSAQLEELVTGMVPVQLA